MRIDKLTILAPFSGTAGFRTISAGAYVTAGTALGVVFVHWLIYETLYEIGALCPYCMVVWSVTVPLLVVVASIALRPLAANPAAQALYHWRWPLVTLWFTAVLLLILVRFWDYWSTLI